MGALVSYLIEFEQAQSSLLMFCNGYFTSNVLRPVPHSDITVES
jgi:hypothetical protein